MKNIHKLIPAVVVVLLISLVFTVPKSLEKNEIETVQVVNEIDPEVQAEEVESVSESKEFIETITKSEDKSIVNTQLITNTPVSENTNTVSPTPTNSQAIAQTTTSVNRLSIVVNINNESSFTINIDDGKNQCDVLSQALSEGKLSSVDMKYHESLGSYGVYQINGIGKTDQVWWTYKVNGTSPPYGCSQAKIKDADQVLWEYQGK